MRVAAASLRRPLAAAASDASASVALRVIVSSLRRQEKKEKKEKDKEGDKKEKKEKKEKKDKKARIAAQAQARL